MLRVSDFSYKQVYRSENMLKLLMMDSRSVAALLRLRDRVTIVPYVADI
jgi:hypothetical protein